MDTGRFVQPIQAPAIVRHSIQHFVDIERIGSECDHKQGIAQQA